MKETYIDYCKFTSELSCYDNAGNDFLYAAIGVLNEGLEFLKAHSIYSQKLLEVVNSSEVTYDADKIVEFLENYMGQIVEDVILELGDVAFYYHQLLNEMGIEPNDLDDFDCGDETDQMSKSFDFLVELSSKIKKTVGHKGYVQGYGQIPEYFKEWFIENRKQFEIFLCYPLTSLGGVVKMSDILNANIEKLNGRKERGTLVGDGDKR